MITFDGYHFAQQKEKALTRQVAELVRHGKHLAIAAILFREDAGSVLYTRLKSEAAERVGIGYVPYEFSMTDPVEKIVECVLDRGADPSITGIIIQKPWRARWEQVMSEVGQRSDRNSVTRRVPKIALGNVSEPVPTADFSLRWQTLVAAIDQKKDVDGLHPVTMAAIADGTWQEKGYVLPATCQAVVDILLEAETILHTDLLPTSFAGSTMYAAHSIKKRFAIIGKSDLLGKPLFHVLQNTGCTVELLGQKELSARMQTSRKLLDADVVISATGHEHLVIDEMIKEGAIVVDVGEPRPDVDRLSVAARAAFLTPVPGGVGPITVVCLLENAVKLER